MHVLVIEDNLDGIFGLIDVLESRGHIVDVAGCGFLDKRLSWAKQYDAVILNVAGKAGFEMCRKLRDEVSSRVPIMMIAQGGDLDDKIAALEAGADDYLAKPVSPEEVAARLRLLFRLGKSVVSSRKLFV